MLRLFPCAGVAVVVVAGTDIVVDVSLDADIVSVGIVSNGAVAAVVSAAVRVAGTSVGGDGTFVTDLVEDSTIDGPGVGSTGVGLLTGRFVGVAATVRRPVVLVEDFLTRGFGVDDVVSCAEADPGFVTTGVDTTGLDTTVSRGLSTGGCIFGGVGNPSLPSRCAASRVRNSRVSRVG